MSLIYLSWSGVNCCCRLIYSLHDLLYTTLSARELLESISQLRRIISLPSRTRFPCLQHHLLEFGRDRPLSNRQRNPSANQRESTNGRHGSQVLAPALGVQHEQIETAREHGHARGEEAHGQRVLRCGHRCKGQHRGVDQLVLCCSAPVRCHR